MIGNLCLKLKVNEWIIFDYGKSEDEFVYIKLIKSRNGPRILIKAPKDVHISREKIEGDYD